MRLWVDGAVDAALRAVLVERGYVVLGPGVGEASLPACDAILYGAAVDDAALAVGGMLQRLAGTGVTRLVYLADLAYAMDTPEGALSPAGLAQAEIQAASQDWTVLRAAPLFGSPRGGLTDLMRLVRRWPVVPVPADGGPRIQPLAVSDLGLAVSAVLENPLTIGGVYDLAGPESFQLTELLARLAWVTRRRLTLCPLPARLLHGLLGPLARAGHPGAAWLVRSTDALAVDNRVEALLGRPPRPLTRPAQGAEWS